MPLGECRLSHGQTAAEQRVQRDARQSDDADMTTLAAQLSAECRAMRALGAELEAAVSAARTDMCDGAAVPADETERG